jgi:hypothetical protein
MGKDHVANARRLGTRSPIVAALALAGLAAGLSASRATAARTDHTVYCLYQLGNLVDTLTQIEGEMQVGVSFNDYRSLIGQAQVAYARVPWRRVSLSCLNEVGVPAERALNYYLRAFNSWAQCIRNLTLDCSSGPETPSASRPGQTLLRMLTGRQMRLAERWLAEMCDPAAFSAASRRVAGRELRFRA